MLYLIWFPSQIMGGDLMRFLIVACAAALLLPVTTPAKVCGAEVHVAQTATVDYSAATTKKPVNKARKKKAPKEEYMRAAPM